MRDIQFSDWAGALEKAGLPENIKRSWFITLKWYLRFCRRGRAGVNIQSARDFIEWAQQRTQAEAWKAERWKNALRWFFKEAARRAVEPGARSRTAEAAYSQWVIRIMNLHGRGGRERQFQMQAPHLQPCADTGR